MRTFIAVKISEEIKNAIDLYAAPLKREKAKISWVKPSNVHITLKFLGEVSSEKIPGIYDSLVRCVKGKKPFEIEVTGTGVFPNLKRPRVIWVGLEKGSEELKNLAASIDNELTKIGFQKEKREFKPHLTIGRVKYIDDTDKFVKTMNNEEFRGGTFTAEEIVLMKSDLKPTGAVYTELHSIKFSQ